jgi:outer membrane immunogenic protein
MSSERLTPVQNKYAPVIYRGFKLGSVMKQSVLRSIALATLLVTPAMAADLPLKTPAPPAPSYNWTGFYLGAGVGMRSTLVDASVTAATIDQSVNTGLPAGISVPIPSAAQCARLGGCIPGEPLDNTAFRGSVYAGWNWQVSPQWVLGVEGDVGWANKTTTLNGIDYPMSILPTFGGAAGNTFAVKTTWDASVRARAGWLFNPSVLLYVTGGAAWLHVESTSTCDTVAAGGSPCRPGGYAPSVITDSRTKTGWTLGGGIEAMLNPNWLVRAEYRYADFGTISNTDIRVDPGINPLVVSYDLRVRTHTALFGIAYKFGGPVYAQY